MSVQLQLQLLYEFEMHWHDMRGVSSGTPYDLASGMNVDCNATGRKLETAFVMDWPAMKLSVHMDCGRSPLLMTADI